MSICILIILLFLLLFVAYILFNKDLLSPPCIFCIAFIISSINLFMNKTYWAVDFQYNTILVILVGVFCFIIGGYLGKKVSFRSLNKKRYEPEYFELNGMFLTAWLLFEIAIILFVVRFLVSRTGLANLFGAIMVFREASFTEDAIRFPFLLSQCYFICRMSGYFWGYVGVNNYFCSKRINWKVLGCYFLSLILPLFSGERGSIIELLLATVFLALIFYRYKTGKRKKVRFRYIVIGIIIGALAVYIFTWMGTFIGREILGTGETISIYLGAPLLNLNTWLYKGYSAVNIWDYRTLSGIIDLVREHFSNSAKTGSTGFLYRMSNGHMVGNVYTTFAAFHYDYGMVGVVIFSALMGMITEKSYIVCKKGVGGSHVKYILCSYFYPLVFLCFFSNRFFTVFNDLLAKSIVVWLILTWSFIRRKLVFYK